MDELTFYKQRAALLMGAMDRAIEELEDGRATDAKYTLGLALTDAEERWIAAFPGDDADT